MPDEQNQTPQTQHEETKPRTSIQEGYYNARGIIGSEDFGVSSNNTDQVSIGLELIDVNKMRVFAILNFSDASMAGSKDRLVSLGWDGTTTPAGGFTGIDRNVVQAHIFYEEYEGKTRMKVEIAGGNFQFKTKMDDPGKRAFMARLGVAYSTPPGTQAAKAGYPANWDAGQGSPPPGDRPQPFKLG